MTREIPLTQGYVALVDDEDYERAIAAGPWHVAAKGCRLDGTPKLYARHSIALPKPKRHVYLHQLVLGIKWIDHRNRDGLDNRQENLRPATVAQNAANSRPPLGRSGFRGVRLSHPHLLRYRAAIRVNDIEIGLGVFASAEEAAAAYDCAALVYFGEFATLNFPPALEAPPCTT